jgi:aminoglycoside/choline kinase family phosphotransferase
MTAREALIDRFLGRAGWADAPRAAMAPDLSARRYLRLTRDDGDTAILMDAPPETDRTTPAFVQMTGWLEAANLSVPRIMAADSDSGLLLLEDLGDAKVSGLTAFDPSKRARIYGLCLDLLIHIRSQEAPGLPCPDAAGLVAMTTLAEEHYPGILPKGIQPLKRLLETVFTDLLAQGTSVSLRDFHADNLMWLAGRPGLRRLGLLDYQDAFLTHPVYDLVSLLTDARADIDPGFRQGMISDYAARTGEAPDRLNLAFAAFSVQRNLRILGIFARAAADLGKPHHLPKLPRVHGYLTEALHHAVFADVRDEALASIPEPTPALIGGLS